MATKASIECACEWRQAPARPVGRRSRLWSPQYAQQLLQGDGIEAFFLGKTLSEGRRRLFMSIPPSQGLSVANIVVEVAQSLVQ